MKRDLKLSLAVDADELASCVGCGLCLAHCPTYRVTADEALSPRGRIATMRNIQTGMLTIDSDVVYAIDTCVQCRGCETACPSGVPFGHLIEGTRATMASQIPSFAPWYRRVGYRVLRHHRLLLALSTVLALAQRARLVPSARLGLPRLALRRAPLVPASPPRADAERVWLFTGCVMDAWQRPVHAASLRVLEAAGAAVTPTGSGAPCCGALAEHAGLSAETRRAAQQVIGDLAGNEPILVNAAGCGAMLKDYGRLLGTPEAHALTARVRDIHEWLAERLDRLPVPSDSATRATVAVQDPCHLRHVQRTHAKVRNVLAPYATIVELDDDGLCCGAGGAYSALHPGLAREIRERKIAAINRANADVTASANPGCAMHLAAARVNVRHPIEIVDEALRSAHGR